MDRVVRVLIVDDSAFIRKVVRQMLSRSPYIEVVGAARDGEEALEQVEALRPDVVTLDLNMPRVDGLEFLKRQNALRPVPVVLLSIASESGELVMKAFDAGAVDIVRKPTALASDQVLQVAEELIAKVKAAASARIPLPIPGGSELAARMPQQRLRTDVLVVGVSTGGPQALKHLIPQFGLDFPIPIAVVLHMPVGYTELFARSLGESSKLSVCEAKEGDQLRPGVVLVAQAGYHLTFQRSSDSVVRARLGLRPIDSLHRPSVDVMFRSAAEAYGDRTLGVVLTGMGSDGTDGAAWVKAQGGRIFTEAEESCVVYGMPRSVAEAGLSDACVPLSRMAKAIIEAL